MTPILSSQCACLPVLLSLPCRCITLRPLPQEYQGFVRDLKQAYPDIFVSGWEGLGGAGQGEAGRAARAGQGEAGSCLAEEGACWWRLASCEAGPAYPARLPRRCAPPPLAWWTTTPCLWPLRGAPPRTRRSSRCARPCAALLPAGSKRVAGCSQGAAPGWTVVLLQWRACCLQGSEPQPVVCAAGEPPRRHASSRPLSQGVDLFCFNHEATKIREIQGEGGPCWAALPCTVSSCRSRHQSIRTAQCRILPLQLLASVARPASSVLPPNWPRPMLLPPPCSLPQQLAGRGGARGQEEGGAAGQAAAPAACGDLRRWPSRLPEGRALPLGGADCAPEADPQFSSLHVQ